MTMILLQIKELMGEMIIVRKSPVLMIIRIWIIMKMLIQEETLNRCLIFEWQRQAKARTLHFLKTGYKVCLFSHLDQKSIYNYNLVNFAQNLLSKPQN